MRELRGPAGPTERRAGLCFHPSPPSLLQSLPCDSDGKESAYSVEDPRSIPGWGRSPGGGHDNPLQCSCLENIMDRGAWWATLRRGGGVTKSWTGPSDSHFHFSLLQTAGIWQRSPEDFYGETIKSCVSVSVLLSMLFKLGFPSLFNREVGAAPGPSPQHHPPGVEKLA